jgi:hypothetical protein
MKNRDIILILLTCGAATAIVLAAKAALRWVTGRAQAW